MGIENTNPFKNSFSFLVLLLISWEKGFKDSRIQGFKGLFSKDFINALSILAVIACIRDAESILILGPGEAKGELKKRLERNKLGGRIVGIETIDRMTDRQIAAKVRRYFKEKRDEKGHYREIR